MESKPISSSIPTPTAAKAFNTLWSPGIEIVILPTRLSLKVTRKLVLSASLEISEALMSACGFRPYVR